MKKIEERHNKNKEMSKKFIANKISTEREKYEISHEKFLLMKKIEEELQKEKAFKKYEGYYFIMKEKKERQKEKKEISNNKLMEKQERLKELDLKNDKERKKIIKKLEIMEMKKQQIDKEKEEYLQKIKEIRDAHFQETYNNKKLLSKEEEERRLDILDYENYKFDLALRHDYGNKKRRINSQSKIISSQKEEEQKLKSFMKIMNNLQDDSVSKKNEKEKRMMYNGKARKIKRIRSKK